MRKSILALTLSLLLVPAFGFSEENDNSVKFNEYKKIAPNLYEVTVDNYDYDYLLKEGACNNSSAPAGCSALRAGNFLGRNLDFIAGDVPEIIVKTPAKKGRYASVGMVGALMWLDGNTIESNQDEDAKQLIPLALVDGINEKGLVAELNCVNAVDVGGLTVKSNPGKKEISKFCLIRYLLDNAASADEAIELLKNSDVVVARDVLGLAAANYDLHFLIADKDKTYVVEFNNTKPDGEKMIVLPNEPIMTNFYLHLANYTKGSFPAHAEGVERYRKLVAQKRAIKSVADMKRVMQSIRYSNSSRQDGVYAPGKDFSNRFTCFSDNSVPDNPEVIYANYKEHIPELLSVMKNMEIETTNLLKDPKMYNPNSLWVTSHNTVYDIENKTMSVAIYERFNKYYDYSAK